MNNLYSQQKKHFFFISKKVVDLQKNAISTTQALKKTFYLKLYPKITLHIQREERRLLMLCPCTFDGTKTCSETYLILF